MALFRRRKIGFAVIGLGDIAQEAVLPAFKNARRYARLAALVSGDATKRRELARIYDVPAFGYDELDECLARDDVDAAYIALPNEQHADYTDRCARAGVHVLCEKPMAMTGGDCERMIRACQEHAVRLMIAYRLHFEPANLRAIELVQRGRIGHPRFFDSTFSYQVQHGNIRTRASSGGALFDIGIYCLNAARYLFRDEPEEVFAYGRGEGLDDRFQGVPATFAVVLRFPHERVAQFTCCYAAEATGSYRIVGSDGCLELESAYEYEGRRVLTLTRAGKSRTEKFKTTDQFGPELIEFSRCILKGRDPEPDGHEGLADVRVLNAIQESLLTGAPVRVEPVRRPRRPTPDQELVRPPVKAPATVENQPPVGN